MPVYDWDATTGKKYSLLLVELMRPGLPRGIALHYFAYNVRNGTAVNRDLDTTLGGWRAPTHGRVGSPGLYVHLLFEHEAGLAVNLSAAMRIAGSDAATDLTTFMATVGLNNATLVSLNWMAVRGSILSRTSIDADRCVRNLPHAPVVCANDEECNVAPICRCCRYNANCSDLLHGKAAAPSVLDMCDTPVDTTCSAFRPTPTSEGGLSMMAIVGIVAAAVGLCVMLVLTIRRIRSKPAVLPEDDGSHEGPRRQWTANAEYDTIIRRRRIERMATEEQTYTLEEMGMIERCMSLFDAFDLSLANAKELKHASTMEFAQTKCDLTTGKLVGRSGAVIRGASPQDLVAYAMEYDSRHMLSNWDLRVAPRSEILEVVNEHHIVVYVENHTPGFHNRTFLNSIIWQQLSTEPRIFVLCVVPIDQHDQIGPADEEHAVRAEVMRCYRFTALRPDVTLFEYACWLELKGHVPKLVIDTVAIPQAMHVPITYQTYFLQLRPVAACTADDGALAANLLMDQVAHVKNYEIPTVVSKFVTQTAMLRTCHFVHIGTMLLAIELHTLGTVQDVAVVDPASLSVEQARSIGRGFGSMIIGNTLPEAALDEFYRTYPSMHAMDRDVWFRPMMEAVATRRMRSSPLGLRMRVGVGTVVSIGDTVSDVIMVVSFLSTGQTGAAYGTIAMVGLCVMLQIAVAVYQNQHRGWVAVAYEVGIVLCFLRAPVDAYRVASGQKQQPGDPVDPLNMLTVGKAFEMVGEAIPALILQSAILMAIADPSMVAVVSIVFSCLAIAYTSTTIAYDFETDPTRRRNNPEFYGYALSPPSTCHAT
jgi:hypothetical protein